MKVRLNALLQTVTPMHIAAAGSYRLIAETGYVERESERNKNNSACTGVQKIALAGDFPMPVIAANNIAGRLRRYVAELVLNAATTAGRKVSLQAYSAMMCGAVGGSPDKRDLTYAEYKKSAEHPYIGLMGGGPRMLRRKVSVLNALPVCNESKSLMDGVLMHPRAGNYDQDGHRLTQAWHFRRNDDLMEMVNVGLQEQSIQDYETAIQARQAAILTEKSKTDERSTTSTFTWSALEFVVPGAIFNVVFELDVANEAQIGLFLMALDSFVSRERLGGHSRNGFGAFRLHDVVLTNVDTGEVFEEGDSIFNNGRLVQSHHAVAPLIEAWVSAAAHIDVDTIEEMMTMPSDAAGGKKSKKASA